MNKENRISSSLKHNEANFFYFIKLELFEPDEATCVALKGLASCMGIQLPKWGLKLLIIS